LERLATNIGIYRDIVEKIKGSVHTNDIEEELKKCKKEYEATYEKWKTIEDRNKELRDKSHR
jgi:cell shape-determining protein MreC